MFKALFAMYELQPSQMIKRMAQRFYCFNEGQKLRRKWERQLPEKPKYKPTINTTWE